jgi:hypothetical protein
MQLSILVPALMVAVGWFVAAWLTRRREDRTKRLQITIEQAEKQVNDFYSPMIFLIEQLDAIHNAKSEMVEAQPDNQEIIERVAYSEHFLPTHQEIANLLKTKIHLLEAREVPSSVLDYINHFTSENIARSVEKDGIDVWAQVKEFPSDLFDDLQRDRELVYRRYQDALHELRSPTIALRFPLR